MADNGEPETDQNQSVEEAALAAAANLQDQSSGIMDVLAGMQNGGGGVTNSTQDGRLFLAIAQGNEDMQREHAVAAMETWQEEARSRLKLRMGADAAEPDAGAIQAEMIANMQRQLTELNGGELADAAEDKINELMSMNGEQFADAMVENATLSRNAAIAHQQQVRAAQEAGAAAPAAELVGILAVLMTPQEGNPTPNLANINVDNVDTSPEGQINTKMENTFDAMAQFANMGNGAETALAQIQGERWGSFNEDTLQYEGLNRMESFGNRGSATFRQELEAFISPEGLGAVRENANGIDYNNWSLKPGGEGGAVNMDNLFTQPMVDNGLVEFDTPEAREAWNAHLGGGLAEQLHGEALQERMEMFAHARDDIDMQTENNAENEAAAARREYVRDNADDVDVSADVEPEQNEADAEAPVVEVAQVDDPVSAAGAVAYLPGESGVGPLVSATPEATVARLESVPQFQADMRAQRELNAVPEYSPLAQMDPNLPQPGMGPGASV